MESVDAVGIGNGYGLEGVGGVETNKNILCEKYLLSVKEIRE